MNVSLSYLNSINLRSADKPYSACFDGHRYVRRYLMGDVLRVQLVVSGLVGSLQASKQLIDCTGATVVGSVVSQSSVREGYNVLDFIVSWLQDGEYTLRVQLMDSGDGSVIILIIILKLLTFQKTRT